MKRLWLFIVLLYCSHSTRAQFHELGAFLGAGNYIGDVGATYFVFPENPAFGLVYKWNRTTRYSLRANAMIMNINKSDYSPVDFARFNRRYRFKNQIMEFSVGAEVNFTDFNLHGNEKMVSPYLFMGVGYIRYNLFYHEPNTLETVEYGKGNDVALPAIVGVKANISPFVVLGLEVGVRYTFTDNLDGSAPESETNVPNNLKFGNLHNNDWYVFTGLTISFTFGDLPCYCKE
ncbi:MAG: DUF6089 family protein [Flavobacteriaceae bacterium]|jgi:opacity protein-like surface antigen